MSILLNWNRPITPLTAPIKAIAITSVVPAGGKKSVNAVWTYADPYPAVAQIKGHVAFYLDRVDEIAEPPNRGNYYGRDNTREKQSARARSLGYIV